MAMLNNQRVDCSRLSGNAPIKNTKRATRLPHDELRLFPSVWGKEGLGVALMLAPTLG